MRSIRLALVMALTMLLTGPAWSQAPSGWLPAVQSWSPEPPYTFVRGHLSPYTLYFWLSEPGLVDFEAGDIFITYSDKVFAPIALLTDVMPTSLTVLGTGISGPDDGTKQAHILLAQTTPSYSANIPAGPVFGVQFEVKNDAPLGSTEVGFAYTFYFTDLTPAKQETGWNEWTDSIPKPPDPWPSLSVNIVAIPEPGTWAMMLAGLVVVGTCAVRARRKT